MRFRVARAVDLPSGATKSVSVQGLPIVLVNDAGNLYALYGLCSHQGRPLEGGKVWRGVLDCPWHHFQWDLRTGENIYPKSVYPLNAMPRLRDQVRTLPTYPVEVVRGDLEVEIPAESLPGHDEAK